MKIVSVSSIDISNEIVLHKRWNSQFHIWKSRWRFQGVKHKILHYSHMQIWRKFFQHKVRVLCTSYMKVWTQNILQTMWIFFLIRVMKIWMQILWQEIQKCLFHISKYGHRFSHMKYGIFSYFSFENCHAVFPSRNIKYCLFNIWKKCIHSPTRNVEFSQRFSCLSSEILYISIKKAWMKVFWYETWNSVYFT